MDNVFVRLDRVFRGYYGKWDLGKLSQKYSNNPLRITDNKKTEVNQPGIFFHGYSLENLDLIQLGIFPILGSTGKKLIHWDLSNPELLAKTTEKPEIHPNKHLKPLYKRLGKIPNFQNCQ